MPVYATNPNKLNPDMKKSFCYHIELIIGDKLEKREIIASNFHNNNLHYSFFKENELVALYPINFTIISSIETL